MFAGVVLAFLDPSELGNYITKVDLGPGGAFALVSFDGFMYTLASRPSRWAASATMRKWKWIRQTRCMAPQNSQSAA